MTSWSKESILHFIDMYCSLECLWKIKSKEYSNKHLKEKAYERLVEFCQSFDRTANKDTVTKKIDNTCIRSSFRKELKKEEQSYLSGAGSDEVYESKLWYFKDLMFLRDQETPRAGRSNIETSHQEAPSEKESDLPEAVEPLSSEAESETSISLGDQQGEETSQLLHFTQSNSGSQTPPAAPRPQLAKYNRKRKSDDEELLKVARARLLNPVPKSPEDEFDIFGKGVACRLRNLPRDQRIHAQKYISDVLYEGELGQLSPPTSRSFMPNGERYFIPSNSNSSNANYTTAGQSGYYYYDDSHSQYSQY